MPHESPPLTEADLARHAEHLAMIAGKAAPPPDGPAPFRTSANMAHTLDQNGTAAAMLAVPVVELSGPHMEPDGTGGWLVKDGPYGARLEKAEARAVRAEASADIHFRSQQEALRERNTALAELGKIALSLHGAIRDANEACFLNRDVDQVKRVLENAVNLGWKIRSLLNAPTEAGREGA